MKDRENRKGKYGGNKRQNGNGEGGKIRMENDRERTEM